MNAGVFFELVKNAPDRETIQKYCLAFPEYSEDPRALQWVNLIKERYGVELLPNFQDLYQSYVHREDRINQCLQDLTKDPRHSIQIRPPSKIRLREMELKAQETVEITYKERFHVQSETLTKSEVRNLLLQIPEEQIKITRRDQQIQELMARMRQDADLGVDIPLNVVPLDYLFSITDSTFAQGYQNLVATPQESQIFIEIKRSYSSPQFEITFHQKFSDGHGQMTSITSNIKESDIEDLLFRLPKGSWTETIWY